MLPTRLRIALALLAVTLTACGGGGATAAPTPFVLVLQDPAVPGAREVVSPAVLALSQVLATRGIGVRVVDAGRTDDVRAAAADPSALAAFEAPYTVAPDAVAGAVDAGLPLLLLSADEPRPNAPAVWRPFVRPRAAEASALSRLATSTARARPTCLAGEATPPSQDLRTLIARTFPPQGGTVLAGGPPATAATTVARAGCAVAIWTGGPDGGATFRDALRAVAPDVELLVGSQSRTSSFLDGPTPSSDGVRAVCGCVDLSTSGEPATQAFLHDFQAATGLDPGPLAAEGVDAGALLIRLWDRGDRTRADLRAALGGVGAFRGLGGRYRWGPKGDLAAPSVRIFRAEGFRWLRIHPPAAREGA